MIYRLDNVYDRSGDSAYDQVGLKSYAGAHLALAEGARLAKTWSPLALRVYRKKGRRLPDLTMLTGYALIGTERAWELLADVAGGAVEALPLQSGGEPWLALNVVDVVEGLDRRSRVGGDWTRARLVFVRARVAGRAIFKLANVVHSPVFVGDAFKERVEAEGLEGLRFVPVGAKPKKRSAVKRRSTSRS